MTFFGRWLKSSPKAPSSASSTTGLGLGFCGRVGRGPADPNGRGGGRDEATLRGAAGFTSTPAARGGLGPAPLTMLGKASGAGGFAPRAAADSARIFCRSSRHSMVVDDSNSNAGKLRARKTKQHGNTDTVQTTHFRLTDPGAPGKTATRRLP